MATGFTYLLNNQYFPNVPLGLSTGMTYYSMTGPSGLVKVYAPTGGNNIVWSINVNTINPITPVGPTGTFIAGNLAVTGSFNAASAANFNPNPTQLVMSSYNATPITSNPIQGYTGGSADKLLFAYGSASTYPISIGTTGSVLYESASAISSFIGGVSTMTVSSTGFGIGSTVAIGTTGMSIGYGTLQPKGISIGTNASGYPATIISLGVTGGYTGYTSVPGGYTGAATQYNPSSLTGPYLGGQQPTNISIGYGAGYEGDPIYIPATTNLLTNAVFLNAAVNGSSIVLPVYGTNTYYTSLTKGATFVANVSSLSTFTTLYMASPSIGIYYFALGLTLPSYYNGSSWVTPSGTPSAISLYGCTSSSFTTLLYATGNIATLTTGSVYWSINATLTSTPAFTQITTANGLPATTGYWTALSMSASTNATNGYALLAYLSGTIVGTSTSKLYMSPTIGITTGSLPTIYPVTGTPTLTYPFYWTFSALSSLGQYAIACNSAGSVFVSSNGGIGASPSSLVWTEVYTTGYPITSTSISSTGQYMAVSTANGVFVSYTFGSIWYATLFPTTLSSVSSTTLSPDATIMVITGIANTLSAAQTGVVVYTLSSSTQTVSIGTNAANVNGGASSLAIGLNAGQTAQGYNTIAIGANAGQTAQANASVAIGANAGMETDAMTYTPFTTTTLTTSTFSTLNTGVSSDGQQVAIASTNMVYLSSNGGATISAVTISSAIATCSTALLSGYVQSASAYASIIFQNAIGNVYYGVGGVYNAITSIFPVAASSASANTTFNNILFCTGNGTGTSGSVYWCYNANPAILPLFSALTVLNGSIFSSTANYRQCAMSTTYTPTGGVAVLTYNNGTNTSQLIYANTAHSSIAVYPTAALSFVALTPSVGNALPTLTSPSVYWNAVGISGTGQYILAAVYGGSVYLSSNGGGASTTVTFTQVTALPITSTWSTISVSTSGQYMMIANASLNTSVNTSVIYISYSYGKTWVILYTTVSTVLPVMSADGSRIVFATSAGVLVSYTLTNTPIGNTVSIGGNAGMVNQGVNAVALGYNAGQTFQGVNAVAIGQGVGASFQGTGAIAIGSSAVIASQQVNAIAIGANVSASQQVNAITIGQAAGTTQSANAIAIGLNAAYGPTGGIAPSVWNGITGFVSTVGWTGYTGTQNQNGIAIGTNAAQENDFPQVYTQLTNVSTTTLTTGYAGSSISANGQVILTSVYNSVNTYYLSTNGGVSFSGPNSISGAATFSWSAVSGNGQYFFILGYNKDGTSCNYYYSANAGSSWSTAIFASTIYAALPSIATSATFNTFYVHATDTDGTGNFYWGYTSNPSTTAPVFTTLSSGTNGLPGGTIYSQIALSSGTNTTSGYCIVGTTSGSTNILSSLTASTLYYSVNAGSATTPVFTVITPSATNNLPTVAFNAWSACAISANGQYILVSLATGPVYLCTNGGAGSSASSLVFNQIPGLIVNCLNTSTGALYPYYTNTIYQTQFSNASMSNSGQYMVITNIKTMVAVSYNYGLSWYTIVLPATFNGTANTHVVMSNDGTRLLIMTTASSTFLYYALATNNANTIAFGTNAGSFNQTSNTVAISTNTGQTNQGAYSVAVGATAGQTNMPIYSVAIGSGASAENDSLVYGPILTSIFPPSGIFAWVNSFGISANGQYVSATAANGTSSFPFYYSSNGGMTFTTVPNLGAYASEMVLVSGTGQYQIVILYNNASTTIYYSTTYGGSINGINTAWPYFYSLAGLTAGVLSSASSYSFQWFVLNAPYSTTSTFIYWGYNANPATTPAVSIFSTIGGGTTNGGLSSYGLPLSGYFTYSCLSYNTAQYSIVSWLSGGTAAAFVYNITGATNSLLYYSSSTNSTTSSSVQYVLIPFSSGIPILLAPVYWSIALISGNGKYIIVGASNGTAFLSSNGTVGNSSISSIIFTPLNIPTTLPYWYTGSISSTGQYMVLSCTNSASTAQTNIYVSYTYGSTWILLFTYTNSNNNVAFNKLSMSNDGTRIAGAGTGSPNPISMAIWTLQTTATTNTVAIGNQSAFYNAGSNTVSIGTQSGFNNQGVNSIAIGYQAGSTNQNYAASYGSIAIGYQAATLSQGYNAIAIGYQAGSYSATTGQPANTFLISTSSIRSSAYGQTSIGALMYATTGELYYRSASKTFVIHHPTNPDAYLVHACLEGPEEGVYVRGTGTLQNEKVDITLPSYSDALATDYTIHITGKITTDTDIKAYRVSRVMHGTFTVYGPPGAFFWHAYGKRSHLLTEPLRREVTKYGDGPYTYLSRVPSPRDGRL